MPSPAPSPQRPRLGRAIGAGFALACFLGGLYLLGAAGYGLFHGPDCAGLTAKECALQVDAARELARFQALFGGALAVLGLALGSLLRPLRA